MKMMKACIVPSILLLLSLEAAFLFAAGRPSMVAVADDAGADILLPSQGKGQAGIVTVAAAKKEGGEEEERPWKCCDIGLCYRALPRACRCLDEVEQCAPTCKSCEPAPSDPSRRVCNDRYTGDMGPTCTEAVAAGGN